VALLIYLNAAPQSAAYADRDHGGDQVPPVPVRKSWRPTSAIGVQPRFVQYAIKSASADRIRSVVAERRASRSPRE